MARDENFLSRWSRLKQQERKAASEQAEDAGDAKAPAPVAPAQDQTKPETEKLELPSIDSLTKDSDFTVFMKAGVPDALRNQALRKLWETNPALYAHDGLTDYAEDYGKLMREGEKFAETAYKVGRGFLEKGELPWEKDEAEAGKNAVPEGDQSDAHQSPQPAIAAKAETSAEMPDAKLQDSSAKSPTQIPVKDQKDPKDIG